MKKYKLQRDSLRGLVKEILKENNIKKEHITIPLAAFGVVTIIGIASILSFSHNNPVELGEDTKIEIDADDVSNPIIDLNVYESSIDFDNYDINLVAELNENFGSLYNETDVALYREKYGDIVHDKALKWGIDENLLLAVLTEESRQGNVLNLMQIEFDVWKDVPFKVYDFQSERYVDILLTDDMEKYNDSHYLTINRTDLDNPETNISIGAAIMQNSLINMNYHIPAAIQCYNYGVTKMNNNVLVNMEHESFKTKNAVLSDQYELQFMNNTISGYGDDKYFYDVTRFINPSLTDISVLKHTENGNEEIKFDIKKLLDGYHKYQENDLGHKL